MGSQPTLANRRQHAGAIIRTLMLVGLVASLPSLQAAATSGTMSGVFHRIRGHTAAGASQDTYFVMDDDSGVVYQLLLPTPPPDTIGTGAIVQFTYALPLAPSKAVADASLLLQPGSNALTVLSNTFSVDSNNMQPKYIPTIYNPTVVRSITWILNIGGAVNSVTPKALDRAWFAANASKGAQSLENYHSSCSYGKVVFDAGDNIIVGPIDVPASGTMSGGFAYSSTSCTGVEPFAWAEFAANYTMNVLGINLWEFSHRIFILSGNNRCQWSGLGSLGCGSLCYTWLQDSSTLALDTVFHELGHNLGLQHSTTPTNEFGDNSCIMAGCDSVRCPNAPQLWRLGWASPITTLNVDNFTPGVWTQFALPATVLSDTNHVQIVPTWMPAGATRPPAFFISYRQALLYDKGLEAPYASKVFVHVFNGTQLMLTGDKPQLQTLTGLGLQDNFTDSWSQWRLIVTGINTNKVNAAAEVSFCRFTSTVETDCYDGLDNDCNGLTDAEDPACGGDGALPFASPPPVSSVPKSPPPLSPSPPPSPPPSFPPPPPALLHCGDGICGAGETTANCPADCCQAAVCGDGSCDAFAGENCKTCPTDCHGSIGAVCCGGGAAANTYCSTAYCSYIGRMPTPCNAECIPVAQAPPPPATPELSPPSPTLPEPKVPQSPHPRPPPKSPRPPPKSPRPPPKSPHPPPKSGVPAPK